MSREEGIQQANKRLLKRMMLVGVVMFGFSFALVPLYNVFCDAFGLNGRFIEIEKGEYNSSKQAVEAKKMVVDKTRWVEVQFLANRNQNLPWEFHPEQAMVKVHPGEVTIVKYFAKNLTDRTVVAQAVPSIVPGQVVKYFHKIECFCFTQQTFKPGEGRDMPLQFVVDPDVPKGITTISIAYTFFDIGKGQAEVSVNKKKAKT